MESIFKDPIISIEYDRKTNILSGDWWECNIAEHYISSIKAFTEAFDKLSRKREGNDQFYSRRTAHGVSRPQFSQSKFNELQLKRVSW